MRRHTAIAVGSSIALTAAVAAISLSGMLASNRHGDRARYDEALTNQQHAAGQAPAKPEHPTTTTSTDDAHCVYGVDTFATTLQASGDHPLLDDQGRLDTQAVRQLSRLATRAVRYAELSQAGPALPQRMGRTRTRSPDGSLQWTALQPPTVQCNGDTAYAAFRVARTTAERPLTQPASELPAK